MVTAPAATRPRYSRAEVARWMGVGRHVVQRWCRECGWDTAEGLSFVQVVSTYVAVALRQSGRDWDTIGSLQRMGCPLCAFVQDGGAFACAQTYLPKAVRLTIADYLDYAEGLACRWYPRGRQVPVVVDPQMAFGAPQVRGVSTAILGERHRAGESAEFLARDYGLTTAEVQAALAFEGG